MKDKPFALKVREKYGDTVEEFALRMGVHPITVSSWEAGVTPQPQVLAILSYAYAYDMPIKTDAADVFQNMSAPELVEHLMRMFDDTISGLAARLGLSKAQLVRITKRTNVNKSTKRLLLEAVAHPDNFLKYPKSFSK